tara:strand:- start:499 stop:3099 length:2601 start_codon:yes stop_codon:yes gene_type:complete
MVMKENTIKNKKSTPVMRQYWDAKEKFPDSIMLFRMGDFYETFDEDAKITSNILNIALTKRANGAASTVPLAGFPFHALDQYVHKLLDSGYKVALCEQVEDPKLSKGIIKREVVEILSPGTAISSKFLIENENNFLASFIKHKDFIGYSIIDNSTGEFYCGDSNIKNINNIINEYQIKELLIPKFQEDDFTKLLNNNIMLTTYEDWKSDYDTCYDRLIKQFNSNSLKGFGIDDKNLSIIASGAVLLYLDNNYFGKTNHITSISQIIDDGYMKIDDFTIKNLEIFHSLNSQNKKGTLINNIDFTLTSSGSRLLKKHLRKPLNNLKRINKRLSLVEELILDRELLENIRTLLKQTFDIERIIGKIANLKSNPRDLINLSQSLEKLNEIKSIISVKHKYLKSFLRKVDNNNKIIKLIFSSIVEDSPVNISKGGFIKSGINKKLDQYRSISENANNWLLKYQEKQRSISRINSLKINFNKIFGYYIDVRKIHLDKIPDNFIRKQTLANSERYYTTELKEYEEKILSSNDKCFEIEKYIFDSIQNKITLSFNKIQNSAQILAYLDVICSNASVAINYNYCKPKFSNKSTFELKKSRHPVVERLLPFNEQFVPNNLNLNQLNKQIAIITGPNMAGKSTYLRQIGLIALLAQIGSFVPAEKCTLGLVDQLFTRVGASDNLAGGESTFLVEMNEAANILNNATSKSLIILDEIGRGTATFDGLSLAWSITEYLHNNKKLNARTMFATHYHELIYLANKLKKAFNLNIEVKEHNEELIFLRKIKEGGANKSYGIQVAEMAGLPSEIISRSKELLLKFSSDKMKDDYNLDNDKKQLNLFKYENKLIKKLKSINLNKISPIESLNFLNELKKEINDN